MGRNWDEKLPNDKNRFEVKRRLHNTFFRKRQTDTSEGSIKEEFYQSLEQVLLNVPTKDYLIVMGDFNARVGNNPNIFTGFTSCIGKNGFLKTAIRSQIDHILEKK